MLRTILVLIVLSCAVPGFAQTPEAEASEEFCGTQVPAAGALAALSGAQGSFASVTSWQACSDCEDDASPLAPRGEGATVLFHVAEQRLEPFPSDARGNCRSFTPRPRRATPLATTADFAWTLEQEPARLDARYCPWNDDQGTLCMSFLCEPDEQRWSLLARGELDGLTFDDVLEVEVDFRVDGELAGYLTLSARAGKPDRYLTVYVPRIDDMLLGMLRKGERGSITVRAGERETELGITLDGSSRALGTVLANCPDLQRRATPEIAPDRFVLLNGPSTEAAVATAREVLAERLAGLLAPEGGPDPDVRSAVEAQLMDRWRFVHALVGSSPELGESGSARYLLVRPPGREWVIFDPEEDPPSIWIDVKRPIGAWPNLLLAYDRRDGTYYERWYWDGDNYLYRETLE
jgi:hypothetical protein